MLNLSRFVHRQCQYIACGIVLLLSITGCRAMFGITSDVKVVNGVLAQSNDAVARSTVGLTWSKNNNGSNGCSGTLVGRRAVLTAAHCFTAVGPVDQLQVTFGLQRASPSTILIAAKSYHIYEGPPDSGNGNAKVDSDRDDVAVVILAADAPENYHSVPIAADTAAIEAGNVMTIAGFGLTGADNLDSGTLRRADVVLSSVDKEDRSLHFFEDADRITYKGMCFGDSGGPAYLIKDGQMLLIGVARSTDLTCRERSIYTDVRPFFPWVNKRVAASL